LPARVTVTLCVWPGHTFCGKLPVITNWALTAPWFPFAPVSLTW